MNAIDLEMEVYGTSIEDVDERRFSEYSGVKRALAGQPAIELINDVEGEQFKVIIPRPKKR